MTLFHAVVWTDHESAQVLQFDAEHVVADKVFAHTRHTRHQTRQHSENRGNAVHSEHAFFAEVCDALDGIKEVLVAGSHTALADFRRYTDQHRPQTAARIVGYEVVDHPTENQLVALARKAFVKYDAMNPAALP